MGVIYLVLNFIHLGIESKIGGFRQSIESEEYFTRVLNSEENLEGKKVKKKQKREEGKEGEKKFKKKAQEKFLYIGII